MKLVYILFAAIILNALSWVVLTPIWQYPDEQAHFSQIQNIAEANTDKNISGFNTSAEVNISEEILGTERYNGNNKFTYHPEYNIPYNKISKDGLFESTLRNLPKSTRTNLVKTEATANPPLYYFGGASVYKAFYNSSLIERVYAIRLFSIILFVLSAVVAYRASVYIFKSNLHVRVLLTALIAFMPMYVHASTGILPDPLTNLIFTLFIFVLLNILSTTLTMKKLLLLSLLILIGYLTRQQFTILIPIAFWGLILEQIKKGNIKKILLSTIGMLTISVVLLKFKIAIPEIGHKGFGINSFMELLSFTAWTLKHSYTEVLPWYWGVYRWLSLTLPHFVYQIINRIILVGVIGLLWILFEKLREKKLTQFDYNIIFLFGSSLIYFTIFTLGDYFFSKQYGYSFGIQGRYFFPLIFAHMTLLLTGLLKIGSLTPIKIKKFVKSALIGLVIIFNLYTLYFVTRSYYDMSTFANFVIQASQYKPFVVKGIPMLAIPMLAFFAQALLIIKYTVESSNKKNYESN